LFNENKGLREAMKAGFAYMNDLTVIQTSQVILGSDVKIFIGPLLLFGFLFRVWQFT
jgi:hypothetical protein